MNCSKIMNVTPLTLSPDTTVEEALECMRKAGVRAAAVTDSAGTVMGLFSLRNLMETILPVSMSDDSGMSGVVVNNAPGLDLRMQRVLMQSVAAVMDRRFSSVYPDTAESQAARLIANKGESVIVLDEDTGRLHGMISDQCLVDGLLSSFNAANRKKSGA